MPATTGIPKFRGSGCLLLQGQCILRPGTGMPLGQDWKAAHYSQHTMFTGAQLLNGPMYVPQRYRFWQNFCVFARSVMRNILFEMCCAISSNRVSRLACKFHHN